MDSLKKAYDSIEPGLLLNSILASIPFGVIVLNPAGIILHMNKMARTLMSIQTPADKLQGVHIQDHIQHIPEFAGDFSSFIKAPTDSFSFDSILHNERYLEITTHPINGGILLIIYDVTGVKELESNSVQAIILSQENERRRLARELHDGIAPLLSSAKLELDMYLEEIKEYHQKSPEEKLWNIRNTIDTISADIRNLSHRLIPRLLEEFGLFSAFKNLVSRLNSPTGAQIELICNMDQNERVEKDIELNLFRCGQELLNNALKYSQAKRIVVQLIRHDNSIVLMVEDDGIGFNQNEGDSDQSGIGLMNIETRVRTLNGEFIIESVSNRGTLVSIEIPI